MPNRFPVISRLMVAVFAFAIIGCERSSSDSSSTKMTRIKLQGTGASFPAPLYLRWFKDFEKRNNNLMVDYQAKGSGAGIQDLINQTVDFAASDAAMTDDEIAKVEREVVLLPLTAGEIVFAYNLPNGPSDLRLSREAYTKILMGDLQKWNDPLILSSNPGATLPDSPIIVVVRSDSSGTTNVLSTHLSAVSESWRQKYGINKSIDWPNASHIVKAPKNDGVLALIKQTPGSIGYVEYGFAMQTKQPMATLENQSGNYVKPGTKSGQAALAAAEDIPENLIVWIPDPKGHDCYPIVSYSWMLIYKKYDDPQKANAMKRLIEYCLTEGQKASESIGYIPLPESMVQKVKGACDSVH